MFRLAVKKMLKNRWLMLSLFSGILLAVLIACTIPMYSEGVSHRMFVNKLSSYQEDTDLHPATVKITASLSSFGQSDSAENFRYVSEYLKEANDQMHMKKLIESTCLSSSILYAVDVRAQELPRNDRTYQNLYIRALDCGYKNDTFSLISGTYPSAELDEDGCLGVIISSAVQKQSGYCIGNILQVDASKDKLLSSKSENVLKVKIVGVFDYQAVDASPLADSDANLKELVFFANYDLYLQRAFDVRGLASKCTWYSVGDYTSFDLNNLKSTVANINELDKWVDTFGLDTVAATSIPPVELFNEFAVETKAVDVLLVVFYTPILLLICFFIFMVTKLVLENDKNEIAMLHSRGASRLQVVRIYLFQGMILAGISLALAPLLSFLLCKALGSTSGFLSFAARSAIRLTFSWRAIVYMLAAALGSLVAMLLPVYRAAKTEIVEFKRSRLKKSVVSGVVMAGLGSVLLLVTAYGYYVLVAQGDGLLTKSGSVQPLAYLLVTCLYAAVAILFILLYPLLLRLVFKRTGKKMKPAGYSALSHISRMQGREKFIVAFLIITISIGVFSSISARTLNANMDDWVNYHYPCDVIAKTAVVNSEDTEIPYVFDKIDGVKQDTKVIVGSSPKLTTMTGASVAKNVSLMGIEPVSFGQIAWWDNSILSSPLSAYLSALSGEKNQGCIISSNLAKVLNITKPGENRIRCLADSSLAADTSFSCTVLAIVDSWPGYYPEDTMGNPNYLFVANRSYMESYAPGLKFECWMNLEQDAKISQVRLDAYKLGCRIPSLTDGRSQHEASAVSAVRIASNGALTFGFLTVCVVCLIGFVIYWVLSVKSRTLQIGTMRALGMPVRDVYQMVVWEQLLLCGAAIVIGLGAGTLSGVLFAPLLQSVFDVFSQKPELQIVFSAGDYIIILVLAMILIGCGLAVSFTMLKKIKAASAIKLGEE